MSVSNNITGQKFRFHHVDEPQVVYTHFKGGLITWKYPEEGSLVYAPEIIEKYIKNGTWIILEQ